MTAGEAVNRLARQAAGRIRPVLAAWWANPLLRHRRMSAGVPAVVVRMVLPALAGLLFAATVAAWLLAESPAGRWLGAALAALSIAGAAAPLLLAPPLAALEGLRVAAHGESAIRDLGAETAAWGAALAGLWRLRWAALAALAVLPALLVTVLRLSVGPGGVGRGLVRAFSAGLLPWALLPLAAALGVWVGLRLPDPVLAPLVALAAGALLLGVALFGWHMLTLLPVFSGPGEVLRAALLVALGAGLALAARALTRLNARLLLPAEEPA